MDETVVALWERAAATYETEVAYFTPMGERVVAHAALASGEDVLDVACGKGATLLPAALAVGPAGHVIGIDIVAAMVEAARAATAARGLRAWSQGQRAFLERLDVSDVDAFKSDAFAALRSFATSDGILLEQQFLVLTAHT